MSNNLPNKNFQKYKMGSEKNSLKIQSNKNIRNNTNYKNNQNQNKNKFISKYRDEPLYFAKPPIRQKSSPKKISIDENKVFKFHSKVEIINSQNNEFKNINNKLSLFEKEMISMKVKIKESNKKLDEKMGSINEEIKQSNSKLNKEIKSSNSKMIEAIQKLYSLISKDKDIEYQKKEGNIKKSEESISIESNSLIFTPNKNPNKNKSSSSSSEKVISYKEGIINKFERCL